MKLHEWIDRGLKKRGRRAAAQLAKALGLTADKVSKMRKGERRPTAEELPKIEAFFRERAPMTDTNGDNKRARDWMETNLFSREAMQQQQQNTLNYLAFYASEIARHLDRIASRLEQKSSAGGVEIRNEGQTVPRRND